MLSALLGLISEHMSYVSIICTQDLQETHRLSGDILSAAQPAASACMLCAWSCLLVFVPVVFDGFDWLLKTPCRFSVIKR